MSSYRRTFAELLSKHIDAPYDPNHRQFIERIADALYDRYPDLPPIEEWPESVRFFYVCYELNYQVGNGGFAQAAFNVPYLIPIATEAFRHFAHQQAADLCQRAESMLPAELFEHFEKGLTGTTTLEEVFKHFDECAMSALDEELPEEFWGDAKLQELVQDNRSEFLWIDHMT